ncbi:alpha/beta hydrolase [Microbacterium sp.]|uniref:alpha/beta fold hydrolase n=1 Tax=Microbacterium sp. TaxID=51671 RepID=UPI0025CFA9C1|nr:alpha/beta hydrolase [Microbacterium sp.]
MTPEHDARAAEDATPYRFTHAGATVVVEETGSGDRTFVLVHGIGMGRRVFGDLTDVLRPHGRVIAIDQPGYGAAPEPVRTLTMERSADLLAAFLRYRRPPGIVLVGHSMGTQVVTEIAARHPDVAAGIVLVAPTVDIEARSAARQLGRLARDLAVESPVVLVKGAQESLHAGPNLRRKMHAMLAHRPEDAYGRIDVPALVLRGENDYVSPRGWCETVVALLRNGRLAEVAGHGHETMIRDPRPAAEHILEFSDGL